MDDAYTKVYLGVIRGAVEDVMAEELAQWPPAKAAAALKGTQDRTTGDSRCPTGCGDWRVEEGDDVPHCGARGGLQRLPRLIDFPQKGRV